MKICGKCGGCFDDEFDFCSVDGGVLGAAFAGPRTFAQRYRLESRLDSGAMGTVFRATHQGTGSTVALKIINPEWSGNALIEARFRREAQALGQIKHPNAVLVMDFGVDERGMPYLVTEFLRGESLARRIHGTKRSYTLEEAERIVSPLCEAVEEAHRVGVVHRDIKASNVFLERLRDGSEIVKVLDFGIAKLIETGPGVFDDPVTSPDSHTAEVAARIMASARSDEEDATLPDMAFEPPSLGLPVIVAPATQAPATPVEALTLHGRVVGTITYMAPEQLTGGEVTPQTDVYAIATLVFRLLAGRLPFDGPQPVITVRKLEGARPSLRDFGVDVPLALDRFVESCFARSPHDRPASVLDIARAVREAAANVTARKRSVASADLGVIPQIAGFTRALDELAGRVSTEGETYEVLRDRILALDGPMSRLRMIAPLAERMVPPRDRGALEGALHTLDDAARVTGHALRRLPGDFDYLATLGLRLLKSVHEISRVLHGALAIIPRPATTPVPDAELFEDSRDAAREGPSLEDSVVLLCARDPLASEEGLDRVLGVHLAEVIARLSDASADAELSSSLLAGLWRHADELVLRDLHPATPGAFRLVPFLAKLSRQPAAQPFALLGKCFKRSVEEVRAAAERTSPDVASMLWRCLVLSPLPELRAEAIGRVRPSELWTVIAFPRTPLRLERAIFDRIHASAAPEYVQVFFLCVRDAIRAAAMRATAEHHHELVEAFGLIGLFFALPSFHEDFVFEPLIELDAELRRTADAIGVEPDASYLRAVDAFQKKGPTASAPIDALRDVPLPIQRKLARDGHFTGFFACHPNERVALETVRHLLKREEIVTLLKQPKIHRAVLIQLAKEERFFRKEEARLALLGNPKTPAFVARRYLPFLARAQIKALAANKQIGAEVRQLAAAALKKLPASFS